APAHSHAGGLREATGAGDPRDKDYGATNRAQAHRRTGGNRGGSLMAWTRDQMAERAAKELRDGFYVNLGIGIPPLVSNYIPQGMSLPLPTQNPNPPFRPIPFQTRDNPHP